MDFPGPFYISYSINIAYIPSKESLTFHHNGFPEPGESVACFSSASILFTCIIRVHLHCYPWSSRSEYSIPNTKTAYQPSQIPKSGFLSKLIRIRRRLLPILLPPTQLANTSKHSAHVCEFGQFGKLILNNGLVLPIRDSRQLTSVNRLHSDKCQWKK